MSVKVGMRGITPKAGRHDYDGSCAPDGGGTYQGQETFSVGIFQYLPTKKGPLKRSKTRVRVKGPVSKAEEVYAAARVECGWLDLGNEPHRKTITIK